MATFEEHFIELWRYDGLASLDPATIVTGWLPTTGTGWVDKSWWLYLPVQITEVGGLVTGPKLDVTLRLHDRSEWTEGKPVVLVHQVWQDGAYSARQTVMFGYVQGEGESSYNRSGLQTGKMTIGYAVEWTNVSIPALSFGRTNIMRSASFSSAKSVAPLTQPTLAQEALYGEFASQSVADGSQGIDGNSDTVVVSSLVAELAPSSTLGSTVALTSAGYRPVPRVVRCYNGIPWGQPIGAGNETKFIELACHAQLFSWGNMETPGAVPELYEVGTGSPYPVTVDNDYVRLAFVAGAGRSGSQSLRVRIKNQSASTYPENGPYVQWNTSSGWYRLPAKLNVWLKAASTNPVNADYSVGRAVRIQLKPAAPDENDLKEVVAILTDQYVKYTLSLDSMGRYGGVMMRFGTLNNEVSTADLLFDIDDLEVIVGYSDEEHAIATNTRYSLAYDNAHGTEGRMVFYYDGLLPAGWGIPPGGTIIVADDTNGLSTKFSPGDRTVVSLRAKAPLWWFGPLTNSRIAGEFCSNPNRTDYDDMTNVALRVEEILFSGLNWTAFAANPQAIRRDNPISTGSFTTEDFPQFGVEWSNTYGSSYWTYDLGVFAPPTLTLDMTSTQLFAVVSNGDYYEGYGAVRVDNEMMHYTVNADGTLTIDVRGWNPAGAPFTTGPNAPATHLAGSPVYPVRNGVIQTGHLVTDVAIYRKAGTSRILDGKILYSNEVNPASPSPNFERTTGNVWKVFGYFKNGQANGQIMVAPVAATVQQGGGVVDGFVEARWISVIIAHQEPWFSVPQRAKFNEAVAHEWLPGASNAGAYVSKQANSLASVIGHLLVVRGGVPVSKFIVDPSVRNIPVDQLDIAPTMLSQALDQVMKNAGLAIVTDGLGYVHLTASPNSPFFISSAPLNTWHLSDLREDPSVRFQSRQQVSQVVVVARELTAMRTHRIVYPDIASKRGRVLEIKDIVVMSVDQARIFARAAYRMANATRNAPVITGWTTVPTMYTRNVFDVGEVDPGGQTVGVNTYVASWKMSFERAAQKSIRCRVSIDQPELMIG